MAKRRKVTDTERLAAILRKNGLTSLDIREVAKRLKVDFADKAVRRALQKAHAMASESSSFANPMARSASRRNERVRAARHGKGEARANPNVSNLTRQSRAKRDKDGKEAYTPLDYSHLPVNRQAGVSNEIDSWQFERDGRRPVGQFSKSNADNRRIF